MQAGGGTPVTDGLLLWTIGLTALHFALFPPEATVYLDAWKVLSADELSRLLTCHFIYSGGGELLVGSLLIHNFRVLEQQMGSRKFASLVLVTIAFVTPVQITAMVYLSSLKPTSGPIAIIFVLFVLYYVCVPALHPHFCSIVGIQCSEKTFVYALGLQLLFCNGFDSIMPAFTGVVTGSIYHTGALSLQDLRIPNCIARCCSVSPITCSCFFVASLLSGFSSASTYLFCSSSHQILQPLYALCTWRSRLYTLLPQSPSRQQGNRRGVVPRQQHVVRRQQPAAPLPPPSEESINSLEGMGFSRSAAEAALRTSGNNLELAANRLLGAMPSSSNHSHSH
ncbi:unnamed protein product [Chrysoparadoxa australica]